MPNIVLNREWLDQNGQRAYPLAKYATQTDTSGSFKLPKDFIVDLGLSVPASANVEPDGFFIYRIGNYAGGFSVIVGYKPASGDAVTVASANIPRASHTQFDSYELNGSTGAFASAKGKIVIGRTESIDEQPSGLFEFDLEGGRLETRAVLPCLKTVTALTVENQGTTLGPFYNVVRLRAGDNFKITAETVTNEDDEDEIVVTLSAIDGSGLNDTCVCTETKRPIYTINGITPDENNNIDLIGTACVQITSASGGLRIDDICATPCCGCDELAKITQSLEIFGAQATTLNNFLLGLESAVHQMDKVVLGSRLNDRGCTAT